MSQNRRQSSQSSLSRFRQSSDAGELEDRSLDFCNSFWGLNDAGVDVLQARMRIATKTIDDLRAFWKERASIEEEYAKRLLRLSKQSLGQGEIAELKNALDVVRQETERQAGQHLSLSISIHRELEGPAAEFAAKLANHKRTSQASIEKTYKQKQQNETYVAKAKERYEADCHRVNAYTAQQTLVQGRELEKVAIKLERAQSTVEGNKRDYQNFTKALQETVSRWDKEWKDFCDRCQDLEEERLEFMKDNIWAYANAVSTVCVNEDESCEAIRISLERLEVERDIEYFIRNHGTGPAIPEAPPFISYSDADPTPPRPASRPANFARSTTRPQPIMTSVLNSQPEPEEEPTDAGTAGIGAGHMRGQSQVSVNGTGVSQMPPQETSFPPTGPGFGSVGSLARSAAGAGYHQQTGSVSSNSGPGSYPQPITGVPPASNRPSSYQAPPPNKFANDTAKGPNPYALDATKSSDVVPGGPNDPLAAQLAQLQGSQNVRRDGTLGRTAAQTHQPPSSVRGSNARAVSPSPSALAPPGGSVDYSASADAIVGSHPSSRPSSPAALAVDPHPAMMHAGGALRAPSPIEEVVATYGQAFPGERRASRSNSINTQNPIQSQQRSRQAEGQQPGGYAGVGAHRSPSPQPAKRLASPGPPVSPQPKPYQSPPNLDRRAVSPALHAASSISSNTRRAASPSIVLDNHGNVVHDSMVHRFGATPNMNQPPRNQGASPQNPPPPAGGQPMGYGGYFPPNPSSQNAIQQGPPGQFAPPPAPPPLVSQQTSYSSYAPIPPQSTMGGYAPPPPGQYAPPQNPYQQQQQQFQSQTPQGQQPPSSQQPPPPQNAYAAMNNQGAFNRGGYPQQAHFANNGINPPNSSYPGGQQLPPQPPYQPQPQADQYPGQTPAPQSTNAEAESIGPAGRIEDHNILFYVKALYDYQATIPEEFDFQAGDVIAVLATPDDGWWQGILLDDSRRQPGRTTFPSNFVCLF